MEGWLGRGRGAALVGDAQATAAPRSPPLSYFLVAQLMPILLLLLFSLLSSISFSEGSPYSLRPADVCAALAAASGRAAVRARSCLVHRRCGASRSSPWWKAAALRCSEQQHVFGLCGRALSPLLLPLPPRLHSSAALLAVTTAADRYCHYYCHCRTTESSAAHWVSACPTTSPSRSICSTPTQSPCAWSKIRRTSTPGSRPEPFPAGSGERGG